MPGLGLRECVAVYVARAAPQSDFQRERLVVVLRLLVSRKYLPRQRVVLLVEGMQLERSYRFESLIRKVVPRVINDNSDNNIENVGITYEIINFRLLLNEISWINLRGELMANRAGENPVVSSNN